MSETRPTVELKRRREEVAASLEQLERQRTHTVQSNSYARARDRAGVTEHTTGERDQLKSDEADAHQAILDARLELRRLDEEIQSRPSEGLVAKFGGALQRLKQR